MYAYLERSIMQAFWTWFCSELLFLFVIAPRLITLMIENNEIGKINNKKQNPIQKEHMKSIYNVTTKTTFKKGMFMCIWKGQSCKLSICFCFDLLCPFVVVSKLAPMNKNRTNARCIKCNKSKNQQTHMQLVIKCKRKSTWSLFSSFNPWIS